MGLSRRGRESGLRLHPFALSEASSMTIIPASVAAVAAAPLPVTPTSLNKAGAIASAAQHLRLYLERGQCVDAPMLRTAMENAFGASDADGAWEWVTEYVPARLPIAMAVVASPSARPGISRTVRAYAMRPSGIAAPMQIPRRLNSPMRPLLGHRPRAAGSPRRFTKNTHFNRSVFPVLSRIPPSWSNQPPWRRWRRRSRPIGRTFRPKSSPTACCPTRSSSPSSTPARPIPSSLRDHGPLTRPMTSSPRRAMMPTMPCDSGAAGFWETAPARGRAVRSPASCSTTG